MSEILTVYRSQIYKAISRAALAVVALSMAAPSRADQTDEYVRKAMRKWHIAGLSLAVLRDGKLVKVQGYGLANVETKSRAMAETVYKLGSVSKQFLASAILLLADNGKLDLRDSVSKYLDGSPDTWKDITVEKLLHHTSGLPEDPPGYDPYKTQSDADLIRLAYPTPLLFKPGEKFSYSNLGYFVLAEIIHKVTGISWGDFVKRNIFQPAGMADTQVTTATSIVYNRANGYNWRTDHLENAEGTIAVRPSGAFLSTAADMAKWDTILSSHSLLSPSIEEKLWAPAILNDGSSVPYGCGWGLGQWFGHNRVDHNGYLPGFLCDYERFTDDKVTVIVLTNTVNGDPSAIACNVAGFFSPNLILKPIPDKSPNISAKVRSMVLGMVNGNLDLSLFTPALGKWLAGPGANFAKGLKDRGTPTAIYLISSDPGPNPTSRWYRIQAPADTILLRVDLTADGKISELGLQDG